ncbi:MAG: hypothetical protein M3Y60_08340 [Bacteroidota bacterium]|nr:hypothetical protein [Bacteroidota bacterium]
MANPYCCYALAFALALALYSLRWSALYPRLSWALVIFLIVTIALHFLGGIRFAKRGVASFYKLMPTTFRLAPVLIKVCLYALWILEFIYQGGIPLLLILFKHPFDYRQFGIPTLHVLIVTFGSFYTVFLFHQWLSNRSRLILILYMANLAAAILIYNRGMFLFNLSSSIFLFLMYKNKITVRHLAIGAIGTVVIFYLFGVMGNLRVTNEAHKSYSPDDFLDTGQATASFRNSFVPPEFFWAYIYSTSPLANLEENIRSNSPDSITWVTFPRWFNSEVLWDFISKRLNAAAGVTPEAVATVPGPFNATTVYAGSFAYLGFAGLALMAIVILAIPLLYVRILPPASPFFLTGLAILNTIFLFMIFDNTIRFSGVSFQIVYPILLHHSMRRIPLVKQAFL